MHLRNVEYALSVPNVSITGSWSATFICSEQLKNSLLTTITRDLIESMARKHHVPNVREISRKQATHFISQPVLVGLHHAYQWQLTTEMELLRPTRATVEHPFGTMKS